MTGITRLLKFLAPGLGIGFSLFIAGCLTERMTPNSLAPLAREVQDLPIETVESSPTRPIRLCGEQDQLRFFAILRCPDKRKVYPDPIKGFEFKDSDYAAQTEEGFAVERYRAFCHEKEYVLYVAPEACQAAEAAEEDTPLEPVDMTEESGSAPESDGAPEGATASPSVGAPESRPAEPSEGATEGAAAEPSDETAPPPLDSTPEEETE